MTLMKVLGLAWQQTNDKNYFVKQSPSLWQSSAIERGSMSIADYKLKTGVLVLGEEEILAMEVLAQ